MIDLYPRFILAITAKDQEVPKQWQAVQRSVLLRREIAMQNIVMLWTAIGIGFLTCFSRAEAQNFPRPLQDGFVFPTPAPTASVRHLTPSNADEIVLEGRVLRSSPDGSSLVLQADRFTVPSGKSSFIQPPKEKTVLFAAPLMRDNGEMAFPLENARIQVVGRDKGKGLPLEARDMVVLAPSSGKSALPITPVGSHSSEAAPLSQPQLLALGKQFLSETVMILDNVRPIAPDYIWERWAEEEPNKNKSYPRIELDIIKSYALAGDLVSVSQRIKHFDAPYWCVSAWCEVSKIQLRNGNLAAARQSLRNALLALKLVSGSSFNKAEALQPVVDLAAQLGDITTAQTCYRQMFAEGVGNGFIPYQKYEAVSSLCYSLASAGKLDEANKRVLDVPKTHLFLRVRAYTEMSRALCSQKRIGDATRSAEMGWQTASSILDPYDKCDSWVRVGEAFGMLGYRNRARLAFARSLADLKNVQEPTGWNGGKESGIYTRLKPHLALETLQAQVRVGNVESAAKLVPLITAPDDRSRRDFVYNYQAQAWLTLTRGYLDQGQLESAKFALAHSRSILNTAGETTLETGLLQMQLALECHQDKEVELAIRDIRKAIEEARAWSTPKSTTLDSRATAALVFLQSTQHSSQPKPLPLRINETGLLLATVPSKSAVPPVRLVPGQETLLTCLEIPSISYRVYWPKTRKERKGRGLNDALLMIPAGGSAPILSKKVADEFAWAMLGLQKTTYSQGELAGAANAAVKDFETRLKHPLRWRFAGFSAGGYAAATVADTHQDRCVGLFMMGSSWYFTGRTPRHPVVFLVGTQDFNRAAGERDFAYVQKLGVPSLLISPDAGHTMGQGAEQEQALRFLATHDSKP